MAQGRVPSPIDKTLPTSEDYSVLHQIPLKFQVNWIKVVRMPLLVALKEAVLRKMRLKVQSLPTCL